MQINENRRIGSICSQSISKWSRSACRNYFNSSIVQILARRSAYQRIYAKTFWLTNSNRNRLATTIGIANRDIVNTRTKMLVDTSAMRNSIAHIEAIRVWFNATCYIYLNTTVLLAITRNISNIGLYADSRWCTNYKVFLQCTARHIGNHHSVATYSQILEIRLGATCCPQVAVRRTTSTDSQAYRTFGSIATVCVSNLRRHNQSRRRIKHIVCNSLTSPSIGYSDHVHSCSQAKQSRAILTVIPLVHYRRLCLFDNSNQRCIGQSEATYRALLHNACSQHSNNIYLRRISCRTSICIGNSKRICACAYIVKQCRSSSVWPIVNIRLTSTINICRQRTVRYSTFNIWWNNRNIQCFGLHNHCCWRNRTAIGIGNQKAICSRSDTYKRIHGISIAPHIIIWHCTTTYLRNSYPSILKSETRNRSYRKVKWKLLWLTYRNRSVVCTAVQIGNRISEIRIHRNMSIIQSCWIVLPYYRIRIGTAGNYQVSPTVSTIARSIYCNGINRNRHRLSKGNVCCRFTTSRINNAIIVLTNA